MSLLSPSSQKSSVLNFDILCHVMGFIKDRKDLLSMMKTCRQHYFPGLPLLFRSVICLRNQAQLESFCNFMLTERPNLPDRFQYFRRFALFVKFNEEVENQQVVMAELLSATLSRATSLQDVTISNNTEKFLRSSPTMLSVFSRLPSLRSLHLRGCDSKVAEFLRGTKSPISSLRLDFYGPSDGTYGRDKFVLLKNISTTLTTLDLFNCDIKSMEVQFPLVHTLTLRAVGCANSAAIVYACPNLRNLALGARWKIRDEQDEMQDRNGNRERLLGLRERWDGLHSLKGDPFTLFNLGLICDVQELNVSLIMDSEQVKWSGYLIQDHHPTRLVIDLWVRMTSPEPHEQILHDILKSSGLTSLVLKLCFHECEVDATLENLLMIMQKTVNLRHLTIIWDYRFREHQTPEKEMEQMEQLKRIDHKTMPLKIARTLGSLDCLVLENGQSNEHQLISNKDPLEKSYWKVGTRGVGEVVVEQVSEEEGETLVTKATQSKSRTI